MNVWVFIQNQILGMFSSETTSRRTARGIVSTALLWNLYHMTRWKREAMDI